MRDQYWISAAAANGVLREPLRAKYSPEVVPPTSNLLPEADCARALPQTDCLVGSPAEFYTKTQPHGEVNFCWLVRTLKLNWWSEKLASVES